MATRGLWINSNTFVKFSEPSKTLGQEIATRGRSMDFSHLSAYLPDPDPVLRKMGRDLTVYNEVLSDAHVGACELSRKAGVKKLLWGIDREKASSRQAKIIEAVFDRPDMDGLIDAILDAPLFGYAVLEVVWERRDGLILPAKIEGKPQRWFSFDADGRLRFRSRANPLYGEELPERKFLLPRYRASIDNPYGRRVLSQCFWPWIFKKNGLKFWVVFTEKYGLPQVVVKHPRGASDDEIDRSLDMAEKMVQDAVAAIPDDSSVELIEPSGRGASSDLFHRLVTWCDEQISKAIKGETLTSDPGEHGSRSLGEVHNDVREDIIASDQRLVEGTFNDLIEWICHYNFTGDRPLFKMWAETDVDKDEAERDEILSRALGGGRRLSTAYFERRYNLEPGDIEDAPAAEPGGGEFAESADPGDPQNIIDELLEGLPPEEMQAQMEEVVRPLIELAAAGESYEELMTNLAETFPAMDTSQLEAKLTHLIFVADIWGRLNGQE